ncbi:MAG TPA: hypothetical protein VKA63_08220 [Candidatus Krumholzibacteria bacterium]|nr:hypothetical protein [Candidatus Krumholzibacteria bacterium]
MKTIILTLMTAAVVFVAGCDNGITQPRDPSHEFASNDPTQAGMTYTIPNDVEPLVLSYDFDDGQIPNWGGNAPMRIVDGMLELSSSFNQWRYMIFDSSNPGQYQLGSFEFETVFGDQAYFFDLKGHSASNIYDYQFGPVVDFIHGEVWVNSGEPVFTGSHFVPGVRYRIRAEFRNWVGNRGRYKLYMQPLDPPGREHFVGSFPYQALNGRLADIVEFGFNARTLGEVPSTSFRVDNVKLTVYEDSRGGGNS